MAGVVGNKSRLGKCKLGLEAIEYPTTQDICWAAGIFEGEGHASFANAKRATTIATVSQKDRWLCDRLRALFGGNVAFREQKYASKLTGKTSSLFTWTISGARARGFLMTVYKFLSPRRQEQARHALAF